MIERALAAAILLIVLGFLIYDIYTTETRHPGEDNNQ